MRSNTGNRRDEHAEGVANSSAEHDLGLQGTAKPTAVMKSVVSPRRSTSLTQPPARQREGTPLHASAGLQGAAKTRDLLGNSGPAKSAVAVDVPGKRQCHKKTCGKAASEDVANKIKRHFYVTSSGQKGS